METVQGIPREHCIQKIYGVAYFTSSWTNMWSSKGLGIIIHRAAMRETGSGGRTSHEIRETCNDDERAANGGTKDHSFTNVSEMESKGCAMARDFLRIPLLVQPPHARSSHNPNKGWV